MSRQNTPDRPCPLLVSSSGGGTVLERVPFGTPAFSEGELQEILRRYPDLLPIAQLDSAFAPATCIGREVQTGAGPLDNLYISASGGLTLVETKLWKNPEARRQVVGQIIDYTKQIARWNYADLEDKTSDYRRKHADGETLYEWLARQLPDLPEESDFGDRVTDHLQHGRFLLLIVGDGIRRGVQDMFDYLQQTPQLQFRLGLVEIACYRPPDQHPLVLVPHLVGKTVEVERAVVRVELAAGARELVQVATTVNPPDHVTPTEEAFFRELEESVGSELTSATRRFVRNVVELHDIDVHVTDCFMYLRYAFEGSDGIESVRVLVFRPDGKIRVPSGHRSRIVPAAPISEYWEQLRSTCEALAPTFDRDGKPHSKWIDLTQVAGCFDPLGNAIASLIGKFKEIENKGSA